MTRPTTGTTAGEAVPVATDLTGRTFGRLTIAGPGGADLPVVAGGWWLGRCVCGREVLAPAEAFLARRVTSCGRPTPTSGPSSTSSSPPSIPRRGGDHGRPRPAAAAPRRPRSRRHTVRVHPGPVVPVPLRPARPRPPDPRPPAGRHPQARHRPEGAGGPDDLRPEGVAALSEPAQLPAGLVDQVLDASDTERAAAAAELADRTRSFLEHAGILKPSTSVLDLHHDQVQLLAAVYGLMVSWWAQPGYRDRPLGHMLKVVP